MQVEIWSDIVCPFCYIGKRHFEAARKEFKQELPVLWRSFELQKDAPKDQKQDLATMIARKFGRPLEWAQAMNKNMTEKAAALGLNYDLEHAIPTNSFDGHRLIHMAAAYDLQDAAKERLLKAYFVDAKNISDHPTLVALGKEIGLPEDEVRGMLASDRFTAEVRKDEQLANELQISGVPFFVISRRYAISGAQPVELFVETLNRAWTEENKQ